MLLGLPASVPCYPLPLKTLLYMLWVASTIFYSLKIWDPRIPNRYYSLYHDHFQEIGYGTSINLEDALGIDGRDGMVRKWFKTLSRLNKNQLSFGE